VIEETDSPHAVLTHDTPLLSSKTSVSLSDLLASAGPRLWSYYLDLYERGQFVPGQVPSAFAFAYIELLRKAREVEASEPFSCAESRVSTSQTASDAAGASSSTDRADLNADLEIEDEDEGLDCVLGFLNHTECPYVSRGNGNKRSKSHTGCGYLSLLCQVSMAAAPWSRSMPAWYRAQPTTTEAHFTRPRITSMEAAADPRLVQTILDGALGANEVTWSLNWLRPHTAVSTFAQAHVTGTPLLTPSAGTPTPPSSPTLQSLGLGLAARPFAPPATTLMHVAPASRCSSDQLLIARCFGRLARYSLERVFAELFSCISDNESHGQAPSSNPVAGPLRQKSSDTYAETVISSPPLLASLCCALCRLATLFSDATTDILLSPTFRVAVPQTALKALSKVIFKDFLDLTDYEIELGLDDGTDTDASASGQEAYISLRLAIVAFLTLFILRPAMNVRQTKDRTDSRTLSRFAELCVPLARPTAVSGCFFSCISPRSKTGTLSSNGPHKGLHSTAYADDDTNYVHAVLFLYKQAQDYKEMSLMPNIMPYVSLESELGKEMGTDLAWSLVAQRIDALNVRLRPERAVEEVLPSQRHLCAVTGDLVAYLLASEPKSSPALRILNLPMCLDTSILTSSWNDSTGTDLANEELLLPWLSAHFALQGLYFAAVANADPSNHLATAPTQALPTNWVELSPVATLSLLVSNVIDDVTIVSRILARGLAPLVSTLSQNVASHVFALTSQDGQEDSPAPSRGLVDGSAVSKYLRRAFTSLANILHIALNLLVMHRPGHAFLAALAILMKGYLSDVAQLIYMSRILGVLQPDKDTRVLWQLLTPSTAPRADPNDKPSQQLFDMDPLLQSLWTVIYDPYLANPRQPTATSDKQSSASLRSSDDLSQREDLSLEVVCVALYLFIQMFVATAALSTAQSIHATRGTLASLLMTIRQLSHAYLPRAQYQVDVDPEAPRYLITGGRLPPVQNVEGTTHAKSEVSASRANTPQVRARSIARFAGLSRSASRDALFQTSRSTTGIISKFNSMSEASKHVWGAESSHVAIPSWIRSITFISLMYADRLAKSVSGAGDQFVPRTQAATTKLTPSARIRVLDTRRSSDMDLMERLRACIPSRKDPFGLLSDALQVLYSTNPPLLQIVPRSRSGCHHQERSTALDLAHLERVAESIRLACRHWPHARNIFAFPVNVRAEEISGEMSECVHVCHGMDTTTGSVIEELTAGRQAAEWSPRICLWALPLVWPPSTRAASGVASKPIVSGQTTIGDSSTDRTDPADAASVSIGEKRPFESLHETFLSSDTKGGERTAENSESALESGEGEGIRDPAMALANILVRMANITTSPVLKQDPDAAETCGEIVADTRETLQALREELLALAPELLRATLPSSFPYILELLASSGLINSSEEKMDSHETVPTSDDDRLELLLRNAACSHYRGLTGGSRCASNEARNALLKHKLINDAGFWLGRALIALGDYLALASSYARELPQDSLSVQSSSKRTRTIEQAATEETPNQSAQACCELGTSIIAMTSEHRLAMILASHRALAVLLFALSTPTALSEKSEAQTSSPMSVDPRKVGHASGFTPLFEYASKCANGKRCFCHGLHPLFAEENQSQASDSATNGDPSMNENTSALPLLSATTRFFGRMLCVHLAAPLHHAIKLSGRVAYLLSPLAALGKTLRPVPRSSAALAAATESLVANSLDLWFDVGPVLRTGYLHPIPNTLVTETTYANCPFPAQVATFFNCQTCEDCKLPSFNELTASFPLLRMKMISCNACSLDRKSQTSFIWIQLPSKQSSGGGAGDHAGWQKMLRAGRSTAPLHAFLLRSQKWLRPLTVGVLKDIAANEGGRQLKLNSRPPHFGVETNSMLDVDEYVEDKRDSLSQPEIDALQPACWFALMQSQLFLARLECYLCVEAGVRGWLRTASSSLPAVSKLPARWTRQALGGYIETLRLGVMVALRGSNGEVAQELYDSHIARMQHSSSPIATAMHDSIYLAPYTGSSTLGRSKPKVSYDPSFATSMAVLWLTSTSLLDYSPWLNADAMRARVWKSPVYQAAAYLSFLPQADYVSVQHAFLQEMAWLLFHFDLILLEERIRANRVAYRAAEDAEFNTYTHYLKSSIPKIGLSPSQPRRENETVPTQLEALDVPKMLVSQSTISSASTQLVMRRYKDGSIGSLHFVADPSALAPPRPDETESPHSLEVVRGSLLADLLCDSLSLSSTQMTLTSLGLATYAVSVTMPSALAATRVETAAALDRISVLPQLQRAPAVYSLAARLMGPGLERPNEKSSGVGAVSGVTFAPSGFSTLSGVREPCAARLVAGAPVRIASGFPDRPLGSCCAVSQSFSLLFTQFLPTPQSTRAAVGILRAFFSAPAVQTTWRSDLSETNPGDADKPYLPSDFDFEVCEAEDDTSPVDSSPKAENIEAAGNSTDLRVDEVISLTPHPTLLHFDNDKMSVSWESLLGVRRSHERKDEFFEVAPECTTKPLGGAEAMPSTISAGQSNPIQGLDEAPMGQALSGQDLFSIASVQLEFGALSVDLSLVSDPALLGLLAHAYLYLGDLERAHQCLGAIARHRSVHGMGHAALCSELHAAIANSTLSTVGERVVDVLARASGFSPSIPNSTTPSSPSPGNVAGSSSALPGCGHDGSDGANGNAAFSDDAITLALGFSPETLPGDLLSVRVIRATLLKEIYSTLSQRLTR